MNNPSSGSYSEVELVSSGLDSASTQAGTTSRLNAELREERDRECCQTFFMLVGFCSGIALFAYIAPITATALCATAVGLATSALIMALLSISCVTVGCLAGEGLGSMAASIFVRARSDRPTSSEVSETHNNSCCL